MKPVYLENFSSAEDVIGAFEAPKDALKGAKILIAWYGYGSYCGSAFVLFERVGKLFEVNGSHCSCYGLEGNWEPEETSIEALEKRECDDDTEGGTRTHEELQRVLATLKRRRKQ